MGERKPGGKITLLSVVAIQAAVIVYTGGSICGKMAGSCKGSVTIFGRVIRALSWQGYFWLFMELVCLGSYALIWQQIIKRFDLSIAYANRAFAIFWTFLWSVLIFHETFRPVSLM